MRHGRVLGAIVLTITILAGVAAFLHARGRASRQSTDIVFLPGQQDAQASPVTAGITWTYGGQWMFNFGDEPITLTRITLLGRTPGFHVEDISIARARNENTLAARGYPPPDAPHVHPVAGTVVPALHGRSTDITSQTAEILVGFTVDPGIKVNGFRGIRIDYMQGRHHRTYTLHASFSACPNSPPTDWEVTANFCANRGLKPL